MKVDLENINETEKKIDVYVPNDLVKEHRESIFAEFKRSAKVKGFRAGKVPNNVIESIYGESIKQEIISKLVNETLSDALMELSLSPVNRPDITPDEIDDKNEF